MKKTLAVWIVVIVMVLAHDVGAQSGAGRGVLFDQSLMEVVHGKAAQDFGADREAQDCEAADDFVVPALDQWLVDQVVLVGRRVPLRDDRFQLRPGAGDETSRHIDTEHGDYTGYN